MSCEFLLPNFPLFPQLDNRLHPDSSCNMTSLAMCLVYLKKSRNQTYASRFAQFEDELVQRCADRGLNRREPGVIRELTEVYGAKDELIIVEGWGAVGKAVYKLIAHLKENKPAIIHTYLTLSGHIVCVDGVRLDSKGAPVSWHFSDSYGEFYPQGYEKNWGGDPDLGKYWLSHKSFTEKVLTDGIFWVHLLS
ncbi:MAG: C39 family peptidase [Myxacorys californica WJT36-NPBG1]|jgi:hypothetical protein|nr:C39 family peptidase [Myxacorys californica WJT36-NPBG1]